MTTSGQQSSQPASSTPPPALAALRDSPMGLRIAMVCAMMGTFMQVLDSTIANVALPYMQGSLQASRDQITWVLTSYIVAAAIMTAPVGWLAAKFGRKNFFMVSMTGFTLASAMCGAAQTLDQMIVFRLLQGLFGAALSPLSQAVILDRYPPERRGMIMSVWGMVVMVGPILGPTLGGWLTDNYSWRFVFYVNVPVGILSVAGLFFFLSEDHAVTANRFDWQGFGFFAVAIAALQLFLDRGTSQDWFSSSEIVIEAVLAGLGAYLFIVHFWLSERTFVPHALVQDRNYVSAAVLTFFVGILMLATSALLPPYLQNLGGYSVLDTGLLMAPRGIGTMVTMLFVGRLAMRFDVRIFIGIGCTVLTWSMYEMSNWTPNISPWSLASTTFIQGLAMGLIFIPSNIMAFATLPGAMRTDGAAMINLVRNFGQALGVSVTSSALAVSVQTAHANLAEHINPFNRALDVNSASMLLNRHLPMGQAALDGIISREALAIGYSDSFYLMLFLSLPAFLILLVIPKPQPTLGREKMEIEPIE